MLSVRVGAPCHVLPCSSATAPSEATDGDRLTARSGVDDLPGVDLLAMANFGPGLGSRLGTHTLGVRLSTVLQECVDCVYTFDCVRPFACRSTYIRAKVRTCVVHVWYYK